MGLPKQAEGFFARAHRLSADGGALLGIPDLIACTDARPAAKKEVRRTPESFLSLLVHGYF